jgi:hypothetical protein
MSELDLDDITRIAQEAASEMSPAVKVMGVILGAEALITLSFL